MLEEEGESHFITSTTDAVHGILNDELSGTQLQRALSFLETGQNTQNASVGGLLVEGLADSVDMSSELSQGLVTGGLVATGIAMVVPGGKVAVAKVGTTLASTGLMVAGWSAVKNASELVLWDNFSDNPSQARAEDWVDLGRTGGNALMFGVPLGITAYVRGPEAIAKDISWTGQQAAKLPTAIKSLLLAKPSPTVPITAPQPPAAVPTMIPAAETQATPLAIISHALDTAKKTNSKSQRNRTRDGEAWTRI